MPCSSLIAALSCGIEAGQFSMDMKVPNIERPKRVEELAPKYEQVHREAVARIRKLKPEDLDRNIQFFTGPMTVRDILWGAIMAHGIHHRGQLSVPYAHSSGPGTGGRPGPHAASAREEPALQIDVA